MPPRLSVTKSGCPAKPSICERRAASARPEEIVGPPVTAARRAAGDRRSMRKVRNPKCFAPARSNPFEDTNKKSRPAAGQAASRRRGRNQDGAYRLVPRPSLRQPRNSLRSLHDRGARQASAGYHSRARRADKAAAPSASPRRRRKARAGRKRRRARQASSRRCPERSWRPHSSMRRGSGRRNPKNPPSQSAANCIRAAFGARSRQ